MRYTSDGGNTLLLITIDNLSVYPSLYSVVRNIVSGNTGVPKENILIGATHTHSAPNYVLSDLDSSKQYSEQLAQGMAEAADDAMLDLAPATAFSGSKQLEGMNFVRHYITEDGTYMGSNFNEDCESPIVGHAGEPDSTLQLIKFDRGEKPAVLLANWQGHVDHASKNGFTNLSADYPGAFRDKIEEETDMLVAYFTGASGNLACHSRIPEEKNNETMRGYGEDLAEYALELLPTLTPVANTSGVSGKQMTFVGKIDHSWDDMVATARQMINIWNRESRDAATQAGKEYGFTSVYQCNAIVARASMGPTYELPLAVGRVGGLAFANPGYEMFCESGQFVKENDGYEMTFIIAGNHLYLPTIAAYEYRCYEADTGFFEKGTAETLATTLVDMLKEIKEG